ncbi:MAG: response regulator [Candidatus Omnitrophica bacterium]|nr:Chemotaxis protein CheY [bacterium]NUN94636.1 response regulator [Candidatus Omnitrophota bacterium]
MAFNILVVDDSGTVRDFFGKTLRLAGIPLGDLFQARNGAEALAILKHHWIDLVFTDINMPLMDGFELVEAMREDDLLERLPVVVVSAEQDPMGIEEMLSKGARAYVRKPFTPERIKEVVEDLLGVGHAR